MSQDKTAQNTAELEFGKMLSELRNGLQTMVEAVDSYLNFLSKATLGEWNPDKFKWLPQEGQKGPYEKAHFDDTPDFKAMLEDLNKHKGTVTRAGVFYWLFTDGKTVGRKKMTPQKTGGSSQ